MKLFYKRKCTANIEINHLKVNFFLLRLGTKNNDALISQISFHSVLEGPAIWLGKNNKERKNIKTENGDDMNFIYRNEFIKKSIRVERKI